MAAVLRAEGALAEASNEPRCHGMSCADTDRACSATARTVDKRQNFEITFMMDEC